MRDDEREDRASAGLSAVTEGKEEPRPLWRLSFHGVLIVIASICVGAALFVGMAVGIKAIIERVISLMVPTCLVALVAFILYKKEKKAAGGVVVCLYLALVLISFLGMYLRSQKQKTPQGLTAEEGAPFVQMNLGGYRFLAHRYLGVTMRHPGASFTTVPLAQTIEAIKRVAPGMPIRLHVYRNLEETGVLSVYIIKGIAKDNELKELAKGLIEGLPGHRRGARPRIWWSGGQGHLRLEGASLGQMGWLSIRGEVRRLTPRRAPFFVGLVAWTREARALDFVLESLRFSCR